MTFKRIQHQRKTFQLNLTRLYAYYRNSVPFVPFTNASSLTAWLDISQPVNGQTIIYYTVPGTSTRLVMNVWETEIPSQAMSSVILRTMNYAATHLSTKGDGALESQEDPFWIDSRQGVIFGIWSTYTGKHLTYNDLKDTARGLWSALYMEKKYCAASVEVYNRDYMHGRTRLGYGVIRGGRLRSSLSDS